MLVLQGIFTRPTPWAGCTKDDDISGRCDWKRQKVNNVITNWIIITKEKCIGQGRKSTTDNNWKLETLTNTEPKQPWCMAANTNHACMDGLWTVTFHRPVITSQYYRTTSSLRSSVKVDTPRWRLCASSIGTPLRTQNLSYWLIFYHKILSSSKEMQIGDQREYSQLQWWCHSSSSCNLFTYRLVFLQSNFSTNSSLRNFFTIPFMWLCFEICGSDVEMQKSHLLCFQSSQFLLEVY